MRIVLIAACGILASSVIESGTQAQEVLRRVEERVRRLVGEIEGQEPPPPPPAQAKPAAEPGYLGVIADDRQANGQGVIVVELVPDSPAAKGGLETGDLIVTIDGQEVRSMQDMTRILSPKPAASKIAFKVSRAGGETTLEVTLGQRPAPAERRIEFGRIAPAGAQAGRPRLGVRTQPVSEELRRQLNLASTAGTFVVSVDAGSPAATAGLRAGAVITAVDGQAVGTPDDLGRLIQEAGAGKQVELTYVYRGQETKAKAQLEGAAPGVIARAAPQPPRAQPPAEVADESRLEALERRLAQLEDRIEKLEQALRKPNE